MRCLLCLSLCALPAVGVASAQEVTPPSVLEAPAAVYPAGHQDPATVSLKVTVAPTGEVTEVVVQLSAGPDFDAAAIAAVRRWRFTPAVRDGVPVPARVGIPFAFMPPPATAAAATVPTSGSDGGAPEAVSLPQVAVVPSAPAEEPKNELPPGATEVSVRGQQKRVERGGSDFEIPVGQLAVIAGQSAGSQLELAPGIFLANEGGAGHADQVFLRGFDAEQGQAIEFTVNGVPINEVDNTDGHGYADTHFIIPEVVKTLRVLEGPFDPHQGDFAEAGSADYELGVPDRQTLAELQYGSFNTERALLLFAPQGQRDGTFAAVQAHKSDGYGTNRGDTDASLMAEYEGELGSRGLYRLLGTAYATHYQSAGVVRADDVASGVVGYYGSEDPSQGGDAQRYTLSFDLEDPLEEGTLKQQLFLTWRTLRIQEDFTGFLLDPQLPGQSLHVQRGDGIEQQYSAFTAGARGSYRLEGTVLGHKQALELGYYARYDHTNPIIQRVKFGTETPYRYDEDLETDVFNLAGFLDLDLHPFDFLTLRGGLRQEYFDYDIHNLCALPSEYVPRSNLLDIACGTVDPAGGVQLPDQRTTATALATEPKVTGIVDLPGSLKGLKVTGSYGQGVQSLDARYILQDEQAPFATVEAGEGGVLYQRRLGSFDASGRALYYRTHVGQDLVFNPNQGRLSLASGTTRQGMVATTRFTNRFFDELASVTYAYATFDSDGTLVPYIPNLVARSDSAVFGRLPLRFGDHAVQGSLGLGLSFIGTRALPLGQSAAPTFVADVSASLRWDLFKLSLLAQNITDAQYPLSEFYYASDFHHQSFATLTPVEHFTAAPPLSVLVSLAVILDKESRP